jgi:hypothetical protein
MLQWKNGRVFERNLRLLVSISISRLNIYTSDNDAQRAFYVLKTAESYKSIEAKIDRLLFLVSQLAEKWLQKS